MYSKELPGGVWPVMVTPFKKDKNIDFLAYKNLIEFYINNGAAGLFACCGSSELEKLSKDEMLGIIETAVKAAAGRVPVVAGAILFTDIDRQIDFIKDVHQTGVDAVILATNQFIKQEAHKSLWKERLKYIVENTKNIPLGTYELPVPWHYVISKEEFEWMVSTERFFFHKDTSCSLMSIKQKINAAKDTNLKVFTAHSPSILASLKLGIDGYCGTGANFMPELYAWLCKNYNSMPSLASKVQEFLTQLEHRVDECKNYPANAKAFINLRKVRMNHICRSAQPEITSQHIEKLTSVLSDSQRICELVRTPKKDDSIVSLNI